MHTLLIAVVLAIAIMMLPQRTAALKTNGLRSVVQSPDTGEEETHIDININTIIMLAIYGDAGR